MMAITGFSVRDQQTDVRDQGDRPTCAVFAVTAAHESLRSEGSDLSEESALWSANRFSGGRPPHTTVAHALAGIAADGQALERHWPYGNPAHPAAPPPAAELKENRVTPGPWRSLPDLGPPTVEATLRTGEAVMLTLGFVPRAWIEASADGFVDAAPGETIRDGHAILATGVGAWDDGSVVIEFKNSWDSDWGDDGYGYLSERYLKRYGRKAFALSAAV